MAPLLIFVTTALVAYTSRMQYVDATVYWVPDNVSGVCNNQEEPSGDHVDPPCCETVYTGQPAYPYHHRYTPTVGMNCRYYSYQLFSSVAPYEAANMIKFTKCPVGQRFDTKTCKCVDPSLLEVYCRECPVPSVTQSYPICGERKSQSKSDVIRSTVRWGTGCKQYKTTRGVENQVSSEEWLTCPGSKVFNTKNMQCEEPEGNICIDQKTPTSPALPTANYPTLECLDRQDGLPSPCCERVWSINDDVNRYTPMPGTQCRGFEHVVAGRNETTILYEFCPDYQRFTTDHGKCWCDYHHTVKCRYP